MSQRDAIASAPPARSAPGGPSFEPPVHATFHAALEAPGESAAEPSFETTLARRPVRTVLVLLGAALAVGTVYTVQDYLATVFDGKPVDALWTTIGQRYLIWIIWAGLTPIIIVAGARIRMSRTADVIRLPLWLALGLPLVLLHSVLFILLGHALGLMAAAAAGGRSVWDDIQSRLSISFAANLVVFGLVACAYHAIAYAHDLRARERREMLLEGRLARSELELLKMQLQPHFVFNALHTVSALMDEDVAAARRVLTRLGDLLRFSLDSVSTQEVPLRAECAILERYLEIERATLRDRLRLRMQIDDDAVLDVLVPSLILQPLVENAIRHGIAPRAAGGTIDVRAQRDADRLILTIADDGAGVNGTGGAAHGSVRPRTGVGLANTRARLTRLYGADYRLDLRARAEGGCEVIVDLPARLAAEEVDVEVGVVRA